VWGKTAPSEARGRERTGVDQRFRGRSEKILKKTKSARQGGRISGLLMTGPRGGEMSGFASMRLEWTMGVNQGHGDGGRAVEKKDKIPRVACGCRQTLRKKATVWHSPTEQTRPNCA